MGPRWKVFVFHLAILLFSPQLTTNDRLECPLSAELPFCECQATSNKEPVTVVCSSVPSREDLHRVSEVLSSVVVSHLYIFNSNLDHLTGGMFLKSKIKRLEISHTSLSRITEGNESAFLGLEDWLKELVLRYCNLTNQVDWNSLHFLDFLELLDLSFNPLQEIQDDTFSVSPSNLKELYLKGCSLTYISLNAFAKMRNLMLVDLSENFLVQVTRSMFPQPARFLQFLYLSYNRIKELPHGMFQNMTKLHTVYVDNNALQHLPEKVWQELWTNSPTTVDLLGNKISCDDVLCWMTFWDASFLRGSCTDPDQLRGRRLLTLFPWEVHCNETLYHGNLTLPIKPHF